MFETRAHGFALLLFAFLASAAALLAFLALATRSWDVIVTKDLLPPIFPPREPCFLKKSRTSEGSFLK